MLTAQPANHANEAPALIVAMTDGRGSGWAVGSRPRYNLIDKVLTPDKLQDATGEAAMSKHSVTHACTAARPGQARHSAAFCNSARIATVHDLSMSKA